MPHLMNSKLDWCGPDAVSDKVQRGLSQTKILLIPAKALKQDLSILKSGGGTCNRWGHVQHLMVNVRPPRKYTKIRWGHVQQCVESSHWSL